MIEGPQGPFTFTKNNKDRRRQGRRVAESQSIRQGRKVAEIQKKTFYLCFTCALLISNC